MHHRILPPFGVTRDQPRFEISPHPCGRRPRHMAVFPEVAVSRLPRMEGSVTVLKVCHPVLPFAFPQHGSGRKHKRGIRLTDRGVRVSAVLLLQSLGRHPGDLLRALRAAWDPVDSVEPTQHLGLASEERCAPRRVRRPEALRAEARCGRRDSNPHGLATTRT
jgi:hypothetical protein